MLLSISFNVNFVKMTTINYRNAISKIEKLMHCLITTMGRITVSKSLITHLAYPLLNLPSTSDEILAKI